MGTVPINCFVFGSYSSLIKIHFILYFQHYINCILLLPMVNIPICYIQVCAIDILDTFSDQMFA